MDFAELVTPLTRQTLSADVYLQLRDLLLYGRAMPGEQLSQLPDGSLAGAVREAAAGGRFLDALDCWFARERGAGAVVPRGTVFADGWFLYLGYELAGEIEPTLRLPASRLPRAVAWRMRGALLRDRRTREVRIVARDAGLLEQLQEQVRADVAAVASTAKRIPPAALATCRSQNPNSWAASPRTT